MTLLIAHRGASACRVENTLDAVETAVRLGADAVEVDVRPTRDGVAAVHHDEDLARVWGHPATLRSLSAAELRQQVPGVPTLPEVRDLARGLGIPLVVDVADVDAAAAAAEALADRAGRSPDQVWFCGHPTALAWLRRRLPAATVMLSWYWADPPGPEVLAELRPQFFNPNHRLLDRATVERFRAGGLKVSTWTVDEPARLEELAGWGVDAVTSNDVATARRVLDLARGGFSVLRDRPTSLG